MLHASVMLSGLLLGLPHKVQNRGQVDYRPGLPARLFTVQDAAEELAPLTSEAYMPIAGPREQLSRDWYVATGRLGREMPTLKRRRGPFCVALLGRAASSTAVPSFADLICARRIRCNVRFPASLMSIHTHGECAFAQHVHPLLFPARSQASRYRARVTLGL